MGPLDFHDPGLTRSWGDMKLKANGRLGKPAGLSFWFGLLFGHCESFWSFKWHVILVSEVRCGYKHAQRDSYMYIYTYKCATCNTPILYTIFGEQTARGLSQHFPHFAFDRWHHWRLHFHLWLSFLSGFYWIFKTTTSFEVVPGFANLLQMINSLSLECFRWFVSVWDFWYRALFYHICYCLSKIFSAHFFDLAKVTMANSTSFHVSMRFGVVFVLNSDLWRETFWWNQSWTKL